MSETAAPEFDTGIVIYDATQLEGKVLIALSIPDNLRHREDMVMDAIESAFQIANQPSLKEETIA